jgi:asparagine synthase (glutamine-hydrolysing)
LRPYLFGSRLAWADVLQGKLAVCGICGFFNLNGKPADETVLERMNRALVHRGPDGSGSFVDGSVALAMRRLAIIDLETGNQPLSNEDGAVWIVFNGEIYNSPELREQLERQGHVFSTRSDTETIVHQYENHGPACVDHLRGMFAFAILDKRSRANEKGPTLLLARDRLGIKPLFYYSSDGLLAFSSELTSLVQHPEIPREIEPLALYQYLATGAVAAPLTMFRNIRQLLPGQRLVLQGIHPSVEAYWQLPSVLPEKSTPVMEAAARLRKLLERSVQEHLLSDVPVGAFLSGGIDSGTVVALMAQASGTKVPTFSIRFMEEDYDESPFSRLVASRYQTEHHEFTIPNQSFNADLLQAMITHHGQPTADSSAIPTFMVSQLARDYVKVVLSGDGGDECFAGYSHFGWAKTIDRSYAYPRELRRIAAYTLRKVVAWPGLGQNDQLRKAINGLETSLLERALVPLEVLRINDDNEIARFLRPGMLPNGLLLKNSLHRSLRNSNHGELIERAQRFAFRYYLPDAYLTKVDRMSMANALEVRVPLLDHRLVEFSLSLPGTMHWHNGVGKQLLRRAVADLVPEEIFAHRKQGFSIPLHRWSTKAYFDLAEELLNERAVRHRGFFDPGAVRQLLDRCQGYEPHYRSMESDYRLSHRLFMLVTLELWCRLYLDDLIDKPTETARWEAREVELAHV